MNKTDLNFTVYWSQPGASQRFERRLQIGGEFQATLWQCVNLASQTICQNLNKVEFCLQQKLQGHLQYFSGLPL
jgi:hypothetical protein